MAAPIKIPYLPHGLISRNRPLPPSNIKFLYLLPHQMFPENKVITRIDKDCSINLEAKLSPKRKDPFISVYFTLKDRTKMVQVASERRVVYSYDCPLIDKPLVCGYIIKASQLCPLKIQTDGYPVKKEHMEFFETQIDRFIRELSDSAKGNICIDADASIERVVKDDEAMGIVKEMEGEGFGKDSGGELERYDCAVCLDDVQLRWFQGMRLPCNHVFHVRCIARWFDDKSSCPMCREELL